MRLRAWAQTGPSANRHCTSGDGPALGFTRNRTKISELQNEALSSGAAGESTPLRNLRGHGLPAFRANARGVTTKRVAARRAPLENPPQDLRASIDAPALPASGIALKWRPGLRLPEEKLDRQAQQKQNHVPIRPAAFDALAFPAPGAVREIRVVLPGTRHGRPLRLDDFHFVDGHRLERRRLLARARIARRHLPDLAQHRVRVLVRQLTERGVLPV